LCYAKIAPAALRCGDFGDRAREAVEAAGDKRKFELSGSQHIMASSMMPVEQGRIMAPC
jgi:hypothetical protein